MVHAQWHFSITSMNYNDNCGDLAASIEVSVRVQCAEDAAKKTYSTKEECESNRSWAKVNYSSHGCYLRVTSSPCTGGNIGGGDIGGGLQSSASQHSSIAIGESYFSPTIVQEIPEMGHELEIKLEALNKSRNSAIKGIKTGDHSFDDIYKRQVNEVPRINNEKNGNPYVFLFRNSNVLELEEHPTDSDIANISMQNDKDVSENEIDWDKPVYVKQDDSPNYLDLLSSGYSYGNADMNNVQRYYDNSKSLTKDFLRNPMNLENLLKSEFERVSGLNLNEIRNKMPEDRTKEEIQALEDYAAYRVKEMEQMNKDINRIIDNSEEKKEIDAAILALDVYGTDEEGYLGQTNYKKLNLESLSSDIFSNDHSSVQKVAAEIKKYNDTQSETGFHSELYYNEVTNTYVISCAGSDDYEDWVYNNAANALGGDVPQYILAKVIGDAINSIPQAEREKINIEVVGHSLGGGIASIIGLTTGIETKTFNAARVPDNYLKEIGLYDKVNKGEVQNITAYHTSTDILTKTQNAVGTPAIGVSVDIGDPATYMEKAKAVGAGAVVGTITPVGALGGAEIGKMAEGHRMPPMVRSIFNSNNEKKKEEWEPLQNAQKRLQRELESAEIRKL